MAIITIKDLIRHISDGMQILDIRSIQDISSGFLSGSIYLFPDDHLPVYLKSFFDTESPLIIIHNETEQETVATLLEKSGLITVVGVIGFDKEKFEQAGLDIDMIIDIDADEFSMDLSFDSQSVPVDLRNTDQFHLGHVKGSISLPLAEMSDVAQIAGLDEEGTIYFYADQDTDSVTAATLLKRHGLHNLRIINGGWVQIQKEKSIEVEKPKRKINS